MGMGMASPLLSCAIMALLASVLPPPSVAGDPDLLQDICVADLSSGKPPRPDSVRALCCSQIRKMVQINHVFDLCAGVKVNGFACKATVTEDDFYFKGLGAAGNTSTTYGSVVTGANVEKVPGLNTLGVSMARIDYAPGGLNAPHTHPRATEMVFVLQGALDVGFITTANKLVSKTIAAGDVFVFPRGLVHFQKNNGAGPASVISAFNSQFPGTQSLAMTLFAATPPVPDHVLTTAFQVGTKEVDKIRSRLAPKKA
ncbi:hypothetical protein CFC21_000893 [Triticum aestivum]|uniref:Germin-like protein n=1 Tax=Triticum aestivum TaxID=4565 RepID=A0A3B5XVK4_WHEAT|nr:hypothetical protein CFC21_000893 [Triticum aestivum]